MSASIGSVPPEPTRVWLVREGDPTAVEGTLSIEDRGLRFRPAAPAVRGVMVSFDELAQVRRRRGTPLLMVITGTGAARERLFFYFASPPPLPSASSGVPPRGPRGVERSAALLTLRAANRLHKEEIDVWVRELRAGGAGA